MSKPAKVVVGAAGAIVLVFVLAIFASR